MPPSEKPRTQFVFLDPQGRRWPRLRLVLGIFALLIFASMVWFLQSILVRPELKLPGSLRLMKGQLQAAVATVTTPTKPWGA